MCHCPERMTGNAFLQCNPIQSKNFLSYQKFSFLPNLLIANLADVYRNPCQPSPCGPNSQCREVNLQAVCSCLPTYLGSPPSCRPECVSNSDCSSNQACQNQKCQDPCPGTCGHYAKCSVVSHVPYCTCPQHYTGNPFVQCQRISKFNTSYLENFT